MLILSPIMSLGVGDKKRLSAGKADYRRSRLAIVVLYVNATLLTPPIALNTQTQNCSDPDLQIAFEG